MPFHGRRDTLSYICNVDNSRTLDIIGDYDFLCCAADVTLTPCSSWRTLCALVFNLCLTSCCRKSNKWGSLEPRQEGTSPSNCQPSFCARSSHDEDKFLSFQTTFGTRPECEKRYLCLSAHPQKTHRSQHDEYIAHQTPSFRLVEASALALARAQTAHSNNLTDLVS